MTPFLGERTSPAAGLHGAWVILPTGSCEAHGPHLPLDTDVRISVEMARRAARRWESDGGRAVVLPCLPYGVTRYAEAFPGTLSVPAEVVTGSVVALGEAVLAQGAVGLALANAHFEPAHIDALFAAAAALRPRLPVAYPNLASRRYAARLGDEFRSGACHAGRFESSLVLAVAAPLVDEAARAGLPDNPVDLAAAMRAGARDFVEAGGPRAYFGSPRQGSAAEGDQLYEELTLILVEAMRGVG